MTPEMVPVRSSNVEAVGYDAASAVLLVRFCARKGQPAVVYAYRDVPSAVHREFMASASKGKFVQQGLRGYRFGKLTRAEAEAVGRITAAPAAGGEGAGNADDTRDHH